MSLCLPLRLRNLSVFFACGRAVRCMLPLGCSRFLHLVVLYGYQGANADAEQLALTLLPLGSREWLHGDFNVEPTEIPGLAKEISAGLWVDLHAAWACASGRLPSVTCKHTWNSAGRSRRDFMVGCPRAAAAVTGCMVQEDGWIVPHLTVRAHFQYSRCVSRFSQPVQRSPLWPASWLPWCVEGRLGQRAKLLVLVRISARPALLGQASTARTCGRESRERESYGDSKDG